MGLKKLFDFSSWRDKRYRVSGMEYDLPRLIAVFCIVGVGFFTYSLCISVVGKIVPLKLKELGVSSTLLVFIMSTLGQVLNMTVCQWVSFKSDRYRSKRWGRRVPFILFTLPMLCASWVMLGLFQEESALLGKIIAPFYKMSDSALAITVLAAGVVFFKLFYMFVGSVFHYIYNDVIPSQFFTRFMGITRIISSAVAAGFNFFVFEYSLSHFKEIMIATAVVYAIGMGFMCFALKEPRFPEPDPAEKRAGKGLKAVHTFIKESFSHPIYLYEFAVTAATSGLGAATIFVVFFQQSMGLTLADIGKMHGISGLYATGIAFVIASVGAAFIDRWHPVRMSVLLMPFTLTAYLLNCKWIFFTPSANVYWWVMLLIGIVSFLPKLRSIAGTPAMMSILPKSRYGQFCSARSLAGSVTGLLLGLVMGVIMDILKIKLNLGDYAYRFIYVWQAIFFCIATVCYLQAYRWYLKLGGYSNYRAPAPWSPDGYEKMETAKFVPADPKWLKISLYGLDLIFGGNVLLCLFWSVYARRIGAAAEAGRYLALTLPVAVGVLLFYLVLRGTVCRLIARYRKDPSVKLPHHGIFIIIMLMRLLEAPVWIMEAYLAIKPDSNGIAAGMNAFEAGVDIVIIALFFLVIKLECKPPESITQSSECEKAV